MKNVNEYVTEMNTAIASVKNSNKSMFEIFLEAQKCLSEKNRKQFKKDIHLERSTINKMTKICEKDAIVENLEKLPFAWSSLYVLANLDNDVIYKLVDENKITVSSTMKEIKDLKNQLNDAEKAVEDKTEDEPVLFEFSVKQKKEVPEAEKNHVLDLLEELSDYFNVDDVIEKLSPELKKAA